MSTDFPLSGDNFTTVAKLGPIPTIPQYVIDERENEIRSLRARNGVLTRAINEMTARNKEHDLHERLEAIATTCRSVLKSEVTIDAKDLARVVMLQING